MDFKNKKLTTKLFLQGLSTYLKIKVTLFALFLGIYLTTLTENVMFCVVLISPQSHILMYFFLCILAILDLCISSSVMLWILSDLITFRRTISVCACTLQCFIILLLSGTVFSSFSHGL
ncbi:unnamed protein product [Staurois parvus]|uniref:G-protein coupled receptors family 1 profile domain-containing protein n=1 Tax=Staurois parvus TaxID=386267 RepID=A0ABN9B5I9_9NEOB|nr:unnamed protein product [Staurois parvus]